MKRLIFFLCAALVLGACFSDVISKTAAKMTASELRGLNFKHGLHVDLDCEACHINAESSVTGFDKLLPTHDQCMDCHDVDDDNGCATCHIGDPGAGPNFGDYSRKFNHKAHIAAGMECNACHTKLDEPLAQDALGHFPGMNQCMECHTEKLVKNNCNLCHLPEDDLVPADHKLEWLAMHGAAAGQDQNNCMTCHDIGNDCQACHNGDEVSSPHPRNFLSRHGHDAHLETMRCGVCHEQRSFCNDCHAAMNILPAGHYKPGWVTAGGGAHADEAKFDLESCMACHDSPGTTPVCATCHGE